jgi:hypothetical protein
MQVRSVQFKCGFVRSIVTESQQPTWGRASAVFCFDLIIVMMTAQGLAHNSCPMKSGPPMTDTIT